MTEKISHADECKMLWDEITLYQREMHTTWLWAFVSSGAIYTWLMLNASTIGAHVPKSFWYIPFGICALCSIRYLSFFLRIYWLKPYLKNIEEKSFGAYEQSLPGIMRYRDSNTRSAYIPPFCVFIVWLILLVCTYSLSSQLFELKANDNAIISSPSRTTDSSTTNQAGFQLQTNPTTAPPSPVLESIQIGTKVPYWGEGSDWLWTFGQCVIVGMTLVYIARQVKLQTIQTEIETKSHVVQSICTIQDRWNSETMQRVRCEVCSRREKGNQEFDGACEHIANFFEELGTFVKIDAIPKEIIWDIQSWNIEYYWSIFQKGISKVREECKEPVYCEFENLFNTMRAISDQKSAPNVDELSIKEFVKREIRMTKACLELKKSKPD